MPATHAARDSAAIERALGARVTPDGVAFTVWAPKQRDLSVLIEGAEQALHRGAGGYFSGVVPGARAGQRYWFKLAEGLRPDPVSRFQPEGPSGPSMIVDSAAYKWTDERWPGSAPLHRQVLYELHIGTFTRRGTWSAAEERLPHLATVGVTTLEIMPLAEFAGRFGWGYDGVLLFAPFHQYGTPDEARHFIDMAHAHGLAVILDVVYNHLGPVGNVLPDFSDSYFSAHETDWGRGFNLDGPESTGVRDFMRANVRHWLEEYHFDGLRFDATHALVDTSPEHIVDELTRCGRDVRAPRRTLMVVENEPQDVTLLRTAAKGDRGADCLWNEDWHHSAFVALTGRREAYFTDYRGTAHEFAAMARSHLLYQGQWYSWQKKGRGTSARDFPGPAFVCFLENHDQVANTGLGTRLYESVDPALWRAMSALLLLGPSTPMLFQGVERATQSRFTYFADQEQPLADVIRAGRLEFLSQFPSMRDADLQARLPNPSDEAAFAACRIDWDERDEGAVWRLHCDLLTLRRDDAVLSELGLPTVAIESSAPAENVVLINYRTRDEERLLIVNIGDQAELHMNDPLLASASGGPWAVQWCSERVEYGGLGVVGSFADGRWVLQAHCAWLLESRRQEAAAR
jgi:maltooligosyltrehalose trehalohydrolase